MTDPEIYAEGRKAFFIGRKAVPPASITFLRDYASLTWLRGWRDGRDGLEDTGLYGKHLLNS
jgi:hypothetical protein